MKKPSWLNHKFSSVFYRTFTILIIFSTIPVLIANIIIHQKSISTIEKQVYHTTINMLGKTCKTVDLILKQIDQTAVQLGKERSIISYIINPDLQFTTRNTLIINNLKNISLSYDYISSVYIFSAFNNTILRSSGDSFQLEESKDREWLEFYNNTLSGTGEIGPRRAVETPGKTKYYFTIIKNLPLGSSSKLGAVIINIDEEKLYQAIAGRDIGTKGKFFVLDKHGVILSHPDKSMLNRELSGVSGIDTILSGDQGYFVERIRGEQTLISYLTSPYNQWKYLFSVPVSDWRRDSKGVSIIITMITLVYVLLALLFAFLVSKGIYHPIQKLVSIIQASSMSSSATAAAPVQNEYEFIGNAYNSVIDRNKNMERILKNIQPLIKEKLFINLIMGRIENKQEINERLEFLGIDFTPANFMVIAMQIDGYGKFRDNCNEQERNLYIHRLLTLVESIICRREKGVCVELESDKIAAIINFNANINLIQAKENSLKIAMEIKDEVAKEFPFTVTLGMGRIYKNITDVNLSYQEAVEALLYKLYQGTNEIIDIDEIEAQPEELYYYDSEKERLLINHLKVGQRQEVDLLIEELFLEISENRTTSIKYVQQMFTRLISSIIELIINMGLTVDEVFGPGYNLYDEFEPNETIPEIKNWFSEICHKVIDCIERVHSKKCRHNIEKMLEYINDNLSRDISINDLAEWIGFSTAYVSKLFKEHVGRNYLDYLNWSRIEKAKQLLKSTRLPVREIGFKVGFNTIQTFMRTFKKYEGITPGQYREKI